MFHVKMAPDMGRFLDVVEGSKGDVFLHLPGDERLNLKGSLSMRQVSRMMQTQQEGFHLSLSDSADFPAFLQYMLESAKH